MDSLIFGYGSLMDRRSRCSTIPDATFAIPAYVKGLARSWNMRSQRSPSTMTYLGATFIATKECNGVLFKTPNTALKNLDRRERNYQRERLDPNQIRLLDTSAEVPDGDIWVYISPSEKAPDASFPIVQSYLDICLNGCLEIEQEFGSSRACSFASDFIQSTANWSTHWINDRRCPRRPQAYITTTRTSDILLSEYQAEFFKSRQEY